MARESEYSVVLNFLARTYWSNEQQYDVLIRFHIHTATLNLVAERKITIRDSDKAKAIEKEAALDKNDR